MKGTIQVAVIGFVVLGIASAAAAQDGDSREGVPVVTGYTGSVFTLQSGKQQASPTINPIVLVPVGKRWLIEAEGEFEGEYEHHSGEAWERNWDKSLEYGQVDFLANKYVTVVAGRFLTPFGIYNERLHPLWVKNLQAVPLIFPIGTGSSNGAMLRGGIRLSSDINLNYATYFSAASTVDHLASRRAAGTRVSAFLPNERLEIGYSFQRQLQDERFNTHGFDWTLQLKPIPLDIRGEYGRNGEQGSGYWTEAAYRLRQIHIARTFFRNSQAVFRFEQFFTPSGHAEMAAEANMEEGGHGELPVTDARRVTVGWNYYFTDGLRIVANYGRNLDPAESRNIWTIGIAYRWAFPLGR